MQMTLICGGLNNAWSTSKSHFISKLSFGIFQLHIFQKQKFCIEDVLKKTYTTYLRGVGATQKMFINMSICHVKKLVLIFYAKYWILLVPDLNSTKFSPFSRGYILSSILVLDVYSLIIIEPIGFNAKHLSTVSIFWALGNKKKP